MSELHKKLILASASRARQSMLAQAGLSFEIHPADIDETAILRELKGAEPADKAHILAEKKAAYVSQQFPGALVIGSDQILEIGGDILSKASDKNAAREKLKRLRGKTHHLISAVAVCRDEKILWHHTAQARLTMHDFSDEFLENYMAAAGEGLTRAVGAYELEGAGSWLFSSIEGDYFTILGMPLLPFLNYLRENHGFSAGVKS